MRLAVLTGLVMGTVVAVAAARDDVKPNVTDLAGTWIAESREFEGKTESKDDLKGLKLVVTDTKFVVRTGDGQVVLEGTLSAAGGTPKGVDAKVKDKDGKEVVFPVLYEVKGDTLRTAVPQGDGGRPKDFTSKVGSGVRVTVYKRSKD
jgi:uncharacterized protein (TIGR03067 family)